MTHAIMPASTSECFDLGSLTAPRAVDTAFFDQYVQDVLDYDFYHDRLKAFRTAPAKTIKPGVYSLDDFCEQY